MLFTSLLPFFNATLERDILWKEWSVFSSSAPLKTDVMPVKHQSELLQTNNIEQKPAALVSAAAFDFMHRGVIVKPLLQLQPHRFICTVLITISWIPKTNITFRISRNNGVCEAHAVPLLAVITAAREWE